MSRETRGYKFSKRHKKPDNAERSSKDSPLRTMLDVDICSKDEKGKKKKKKKEKKHLTKEATSGILVALVCNLVLELL